MKKIIFPLLTLTVLVSCSEEKDPIQEKCENAVERYCFYNISDVVSFSKYKKRNMSHKDFNALLNRDLSLFRNLFNGIIESYQYNIDNRFECDNSFPMDCEFYIRMYQDKLVELEYSFEYSKSKYTPVIYEIKYSYKFRGFTDELPGIAYLNEDFEVLLPF